MKINFFLKFILIFIFINNSYAKDINLYEKICLKQFSNIIINKTHIFVSNSCKKEEIEKGLMFVSKIEKNFGMIFVFKEEQILNFWMKNTYIPLDIAYINNNLTIIDIQHMFPMDQTVITSKAKASFALELNSGFFEKNKIKVGDKIIIN